MPSGTSLWQTCTAVAVVGLTMACGGSDASPATHDAGAADAQTSATDAAVDSSALGSDSAVPPNNTDASADAQVIARNTTPVLESAQVRQSGRFGKDLRIDVTGTDEDGNTDAVRLELFGENDAAVAFIDKNGDGIAETTTADLAFVAPLSGQPHASAYAIDPKLYEQHGDVKRAKLELVDALGNISNSLQVDIGVQTEVPLDGPCDTTFVSNRCAPSLGCKGALPAVCKEGEAPTISKAGYYSDELGPRILIQGADLDEDVTSYTVTFLNAMGSPVSVDLDGDLGDDAPVPSFTKADVEVLSDMGQFFIHFEPSVAFTDTVKQVKLLVTDSGGHTSTVLTKTLNDGSTGAPVRLAEQSCDTRGFDRCTSNTVCTRATPTTTTGVCRDLTAARTASCAAALVLSPFEGITQVRGQIAAPSLWDVPTPGCSSGDPTNQPDALVKVTLTKPAKQLVLSTDNGYTAFDTTLYALASCTAAPQVAWCADDQPNNAPRPQLAVLTLTDLPAQDYFVVVDSFSNGTGPTFQLTATVTE